jgi:hypothetical protein
MVIDPMDRAKQIRERVAELEAEVQRLRLEHESLTGGPWGKTDTDDLAWATGTPGVGASVTTDALAALDSLHRSACEHHQVAGMGEYEVIRAALKKDADGVQGERDAKDCPGCGRESGPPCDGCFFFKDTDGVTGGGDAR